MRPNHKRFLFRAAGLVVVGISVLLIGRILPYLLTEMGRIILFSSVVGISFSAYVLVGYVVVLHALFATSLLGVSYLLKGDRCTKEEKALFAGIILSFLVGILWILFCILIGPFFLMEQLTAAEFIKNGVVAVYASYPLLCMVIFLIGFVGEFSRALQTKKTSL